MFSENKKKSHETNSNFQNGYNNKQQAPLAAQPVSLNTISMTPITTNDKNSSDTKGGKFMTLGKSKGKKAITKADISNPTNFRVVQHVGITSSSQSTNNPFEVSDMFWFSIDYLWFS